ncbi:Phage tail fiber protein [Salmonella bongori N268-08]|uniref:Phage tail fiber protein n=6 Tax=Salmonella TaxID=590 RepID=S5NG07_SALBN|nr:phage tail fiber protein [Salmonella bongori]AGR59187.1 Phage tail fiber protein [Salmonella bongori N268-08]
MDKLIFTITDAGRQAIINASNTGTEKVEIKSVGIGSSYYITSPEQTDIHDEIKRITSIGGAVISPDTIHVSAKDDSPDEYVVHTVGLYTDKNILFAVYSRRMPIINKSSATVMLISSDITFKSLDTANITFGDVVFINPPASESVVGVSRFATAEEVEEGLDPAIAVSAKRLKGELDKKANLDSPNLTGTPTAPTTAESDNSQKIATTAFIKQVLLAYAKLASPNFTGKPTAPTADQSSNDTQLATTAFVRSAIAALVDSSPGALDTLNELAAALGDDPNFATTMTNALAGKQPLDGTLTNLSGKDVPALLQYLGLGETINLAAGALQKDQNGADIPDKGLFAQNIGAALAFSGGIHIGGDSNPWTTAEFIAWLESQGVFNHRYWMCRGSWSYADNKTITDTGCGNICLAGAVVEVMGFRGAMTIRVTTPTTTSGGGVASAQFTYIDNGGDYSPGWRRDFNTINKPTAGDVGALPVTGGRLNGPLGIGTDNGLGGNSIVLGDNDTGFKQDGDGVLGIYANNARVGYIDNSGLHMSVDVLTNGGIRAGDGKRLSLTSNNNSTMTATFNLWGDVNRPTVIELDDDQGWQFYSQRNTDGSISFRVNGQMEPNSYSNFDSRYVQDIRLGSLQYGQVWNGPGFSDTSGYVITGIINGNSDELVDGAHRRPIQKLIGNQWYNVVSI